MPPSPHPTDDGPSNYFNALETKLFAYLDKRLDEIKDVVRDHGEQMQRLAATSASKNDVSALTHQVNALQSKVDVDAQRLSMLEQSARSNDQDRRQRPLQTWQVVVGAFSILAVVSMLFFDFLGWITTIALFLFTYFHK